MTVYLSAGSKLKRSRRAGSRHGQGKTKGEVVGVGPGARDEQGRLTPLDVKTGDTVIFGKWSGTEVKINGEELLIMKESGIMGVLEQKGKFKAVA